MPKISYIRFFDAFQNSTINHNYINRYKHRMAPLKTSDSNLYNRERIFAKGAVFLTFMHTLKFILLGLFCLFAHFFVKKSIEPDFVRLNPILDRALTNLFPRVSLKLCYDTPKLVYQMNLLPMNDIFWKFVTF